MNKKLTLLNLNFEYCFNLTDESIVYICEEIKGSNSLQNLTLNLSSCNITDVSLLTISETILSCNNLSYFELKLELCD